MKLEVDGECHAYVAEETPMLSYLNVHTTLESRRAKARAEKGYGPKGECDDIVVCLLLLLLSCNLFVNLHSLGTVHYIVIPMNLVFGF
jgi:hypothetical protein